MKNLLTITFIVTLLCACGGEISQQNKTVDKAPTTKQTTVKYASVEKKEVEKDSVEQTSNKGKSDSAIRMMQGLAKSMY